MARLDFTMFLRSPLRRLVIWWFASRSRLEKIFTNFQVNSGLVWISCWRRGSVTGNRRTGVRATARALRGLLSMSAISPNISPSWSSMRSLYASLIFLWIPTVPWMRMYISLAGSFSSKIKSPWRKCLPRFWISSSENFIIANVK